MFRIQWRFVVSLAAAAFLATNCNAHAQLAPAPKLITKVYRVDDLILPSPNYPFRGTWLPGMNSGRGESSGARSSPFRKRQKSGGMESMMGGAGMMPSSGAPGMGADMMGPGAMAGGGSEGKKGGDSESFTLTTNDLIEALVTFVEPDSWNQDGGGAEIARLGSSLIVRQSAEAHKQIEELLSALRDESSAMQTLTVEARWLLLDSEQLAGLKTAIFRGAPIAADPPNEPFRGQVTCFNGQTVHIVSGRLQTVLQGGVPVVGAGGSGYQPTIMTPHVGALLEIRPMLLPGGRSAIINVESSVTRWDQPGAPAELGAEGDLAAGIKTERRTKTAARAGGAGGGAGSMPGMPGGMGMMSGMMRGAGSSAVQVDRINVVAQQLATSLRVPLGKPVLVGGMTFPGQPNDQHSDAQLYLVVQISVAEEPTATKQ
jgi:hypothetical protein